MNYTSRDTIFSELQTAALSAEPSKTLFAAATDILYEHNQIVSRMNRAKTELQQEKERARVEIERLSREKEPDEDMTDEELRAGLRSLLVRKLRDETLSAAEIAQLKDVYGLASKVDELSITAAQFKCSECPRGDLANALNCNE